MAEDPANVRRIFKLDERVVNRIAAGEVIQRPVNALKELIENSLDAGSTSISIVVDTPHLIEIFDNGFGIVKEDLPLLCERFATSKLREFSDLKGIGTFGFRGEALASISQVAHVSILTKRADCELAHRAQYRLGTMTHCQQCAGNNGTLIKVEELFYNLDIRRQALKPREEDRRMIELTKQYALHNNNIDFILKRGRDIEVSSRPNPDAKQVAKNLFSELKEDLLEVETSDEICGFKIRGLISSLHHHGKKLNFILFINDRLVDCAGLRRQISKLYAEYLPKGTHPFLYLAVQVAPWTVDVNVHPTKHEVHFLHEEQVIKSVCDTVQQALLNINQSRTFQVQTLLPGKIGEVDKGRESLSQSRNTPTASSDKVPAKHMIRSDPFEQKMDRFLLSSTPDPNLTSLRSFAKEEISRIGGGVSGPLSLTTPPDQDHNMSSGGGDSGDKSQKTPAEKLPPKQRRELRLYSLAKLREGISRDANELLGGIFKEHVWVGCVNRGLALVQHQSTLYIVNTVKTSYELFYQRILEDFGNFDRIELPDLFKIEELVETAVEQHPGRYLNENSQSSLELLKIEAKEKILKNRAMLDDYFSIIFDAEGKIIALPVIIDNYFPPAEKLPEFLMDLVTKVDWNVEIECLRLVSHFTAKFYAVPPGDSQDNSQTCLNSQTWGWTIEHVLYPELKRRFIPPNKFLSDGVVTQLTTLQTLYRVFERC